MCADPGKQRETVLLGRISGAHGIRGWVKVHSDTDPRDAIFDYQPWQVGEKRQLVRIISGRIQGKYLVAELEGVSDRESAESLAGQQIVVFREQLPKLPDTQYYWSELIGLRVFGSTGQDLGVVTEMIATGANDVMRVRGERERLVPFIYGVYVSEVDVAAGRMVVNWDADF
jgi:16S rRNA processing protein RimM